ncbi:Uncharacterised protein [Helicobacter mustelae]|nr:Uncharacterised protein [Helicobacter mustelae]
MGNLLLEGFCAQSANGTFASAKNRRNFAGVKASKRDAIPSITKRQLK